jgi:peptide/nickel transport system substrate-binding protein
VRAAAESGWLADPAASRAVPIGASQFERTDLDGLPAVAQNLARLAELSMDPNIRGLPTGNCVIIGQEELSGPGADRVALEAVRGAAEAANDTLLVYYAGHGLLDAEDGLYLALPGSDPGLLYTALEYRWVRETLRAAKRIVRKAVILDCRYADRAAAGGMSRPKSAASRASAEGSYLLAAAPTVKAWAAPGEQFTAFTGELIATLENGVPSTARMLDMEAVYECVRASLAVKCRPPAIDRLLQAQIRAAEAFPYRLTGARPSLVPPTRRQAQRGAG